MLHTTETVRWTENKTINGLEDIDSYILFFTN